MPRKKNNRKKIQEAKRKEAVKAKPQRGPKNIGMIAHVDRPNAALIAALTNKLINP